MTEHFKVDISRGPIAPPNATVSGCRPLGGIETEESRRLGEEYRQYLCEYNEALAAHRGGGYQPGSMPGEGQNPPTAKDTMDVGERKSVQYQGCCGSCRWWQQGRTSGFGSCLRRAPRVALRQQRQYCQARGMETNLIEEKAENVWPETYQSWFCGDYESRSGQAFIPNPCESMAEN